MGATVIVGYLTVLFTLVRRGGAALFEEPENYLHPKAIVELIRLFREFSEDHTIIFSTHSPVALNSLQPNEVTVMRSDKHGFVATQRVSDISEAVAALDRGYLSFGDLLQTDYAAN
jgi:predicted ATPase